MITIKYQAKANSKELMKDWFFLCLLKDVQVHKYPCDVYTVEFTYKAKAYTLDFAPTDNSKVESADGTPVPDELLQLSRIHSWEQGASSLHVTLRNKDCLVFEDIVWSIEDEDEDA